MKKISIFFILILGVVAIFININKPSFVTAEEDGFSSNIISENLEEQKEVYWENLNIEYCGELVAPKAYILEEDNTKIYLDIDQKYKNKDVGAYNCCVDEFYNSYKLKNISTQYKILAKPCKVYWENLSQSYTGQNLKPKAYIIDVNNNFIYLDVFCDAVNASKDAYIASAELKNQNNYVLDETSSVSNFYVTPMVVDVVWKNTTLTYNGFYQKPNAYIVNELNKLVEIDVIGEAKNASTGNTAIAICNLSNYFINSIERTSFVIKPLIIDILWGNNKFTYDGKVHYPIATPLTLNNDVLELNYSGQWIDANEEGYYCTVTIKSLNGNYILNTNSSYCKYYIYKVDPVCYVKDLVDGTITITEQDLPYSINAYLTSKAKLKIKLNGNETSNYFVNSDKYYLTLYSEEITNYNKFSMDIILDVKPNYLYYIDKSENRFFEVSSGNGLTTNSKLKYKILDNTNSNYTNLIYDLYNKKYEVLKAEKLYLDVNKEEINYENTVKLKFKSINIDANLKVVLVKDGKVYETNFYEFENYYFIDNYLLGSDMLIIQEVKHNKFFELLSLTIPISLTFILIIAIYLKKRVVINLHIRRFLIRIKLYK